MLGQSRISTQMTDSDVAAYHPSLKYSFKLDREPKMLLADTVIAARGGLTPEEKINKEVNRFVEKLIHAAEREGDNVMLPPERTARFTCPFSSPAVMKTRTDLNDASSILSPSTPKSQHHSLNRSKTPNSPSSTIK